VLRELVIDEKRLVIFEIQFEKFLPPISPMSPNLFIFWGQGQNLGKIGDIGDKSVCCMIQNDTLGNHFILVTFKFFLVIFL
jgi:hypothetical protein